MPDMNQDLTIEIEHFKSVDSTNAVLKRRITQGSLHSTAAVSADEQTEGRGRRGRTWLNTEGSIMLSAAFSLAGVEPDNIPLVSAAAALAACSTVRSVGVDCAVKWPNDVIVTENGNYRKLCGILSELASAPNGELFAVIGIGINVNCSSMPEGLMQPSSSLLIEKGTETELGPLSAKLVSELVFEMEELKRDGATLLARYAENCMTLGKKVEARKLDGTSIIGTASGLDPRGRLLIKTAERTVAVGAADITVRLSDSRIDQ